MAQSPAPLPDRLGDSFTVAAARRAGVTDRRLRHPDLPAPFHGVRLRGREPDLQRAGAADDDDASPAALTAERCRREIIRRARALSRVMPDSWFFCHVSAAVLLGLPVPVRLLKRAVEETRCNGILLPAHGLDVAVLSPGRTPRRAGVHGYEVSPRLVTVRAVGGMRVSSPASTWAMLASDLTIDELIELGDAVVAIPRRRGMTRGTEADALGTLAELANAAAAPYRRHAAKLATASGQIRVGSASPGETRIRLGMERGGLPTPVLDFDVFARDGTPIGFTEFAHEEFKLLSEYEGDHHRVSRRQWQRDVDKHTACAEAGWRVLRLTAAHVYPSVAPAVARIRAALISQGWHPDS